MYDSLSVIRSFTASQICTCRILGLVGRLTRYHMLFIFPCISAFDWFRNAASPARAAQSGATLPVTIDSGSGDLLRKIKIQEDWVLHLMLFDAADNRVIFHTLMTS